MKAEKEKKVTLVKRQVSFSLSSLMQSEVSLHLILCDSYKNQPGKAQNSLITPGIDNKVC